MANDKVKMILRSKGAPFSDEEIDSMSDKDGWQWIYGNKSVYTPKPPKPHITEICFTGFRKEEKDKLEQTAASAGFIVSRSVTKKLDYLCVGETAGPSKLQKAKEQGTQIITYEDFENIINAKE
jgi:NAD-dependent DNA ligase